MFMDCSIWSVHSSASLCEGIRTERAASDADSKRCIHHVSFIFYFDLTGLSVGETGSLHPVSRAAASQHGGVMVMFSLMLVCCSWYWVLSVCKHS